MACNSCKDSSAAGITASGIGSNICVRCLVFWVLVGLGIFGLLAHKHRGDGSVYF